MRIASIWLLSVTLLGAAACGSDGGDIVASDLVDARQRSDLVDAAADPGGGSEAVAEAKDVATDFPRTETDTGFGEWQPADSGPEPGAAGAACSDGNECNSGYCIETGDGRKCTVTCEEECPFGWLCVLYTPSLPDQVYICVPAGVELCRPCRSNAECWSDGTDAGQACVAYGADGSFCGSACQADEECPDTYGCQDMTDVSGAAVRQCVLAQGECGCKQSHIDAGAGTDCTVTTAWGTCPGERECVATGLSDCSAATPQAEACNNVDDDCDGDVDEGLSGQACEVTNEHGSCPGQQACAGGLLTCEGDAPAPEVCDGLDNDCDGDADEGFPDTDLDGMADCLESDVDGDGTPDLLDNCPAKSNPDQLDTDYDGMGDVCDPDDDGDKVADGEDCQPKNDAVYPGAPEVCDGFDNDCDFVVDEGYYDFDGDGFKDCVDDDDDGDGVSDDADCMQLDPATHPGAKELCDGADNDCDGDVDEGFPDTDGDTVADCVDADADGDGVADPEDNCPLVANSGQEDADGDGIGDACDLDADGDLVPDATDNCKGVKNTSQADIDDDGLGDACDADKDGDGAENDEDNCPLIFNPGQADSDQDGIGDACENDADGDGSPTGKDCDDEDPAIYPGANDVCDGLDNNCNAIVDEGFPDTDADGLKDCVDANDDNDPSLDVADCAPLNPAIYKGAPETCNGLDDDCDGAMDEDLGSQACGKGACFHTIPKCMAGKLQVCDPLEGAKVESCDGVDNDCDGMTDEDMGFKTCGKGECAHTVTACSGGLPQDCNPLEGAGQETCDGADNDCDGKTDEDLGTTTCGLGICVHTVANCVGGIQQECDPMKSAGIEVCDGVDNDCDGETDEGLGSVTCGKGICTHEQDYCTGGKVLPCDPFLGAEEEVCDLVDNDCNGLVDESLGLYSCGAGVCAHLVPACDQGQAGQCDPYQGASPEACDLLDNDCNGKVDDDLGSETCGLGVCLHTVSKCLAGQAVQCNPYDGAGVEKCDGLDNNCDGITDEGFPDTDLDGDADCVDLDDDDDNDPDATDCAPLDPTRSHALAEVCFNKIDDDCDGIVDAIPECMAGSCKGIKAKWPATVSGVYSVDPDGAGGEAPFEVYCDMTTEGGGWTLVLKLSKNEFCYGSGRWTDSQALNGQNMLTDAMPNAQEYDAKSKAFFLLSDVTSLRFSTSRNKATSVTFVSPASPRKLMTTNDVAFAKYPDYSPWRDAFGHDRQCGPIFMRAGTPIWSGSCRSGGNVPSGCGQLCTFCFQASDGNYGCPASPGQCGSGANNDVNSGMGQNVSYCGGGQGDRCSTAGEWSDMGLRTLVWAK